MTTSRSASTEIRQLARYEVRPAALPRCLAAIHDFVAYVRDHEPGTLRYEVLQDIEHPTHFVHSFVFRDLAADEAHSQSAEVKKFAAILYPECLAPVEFIDYRLVTTNERPPAR